MPYFTTPDGRVQAVEVEVKEDGSVRPRNYHDFVSNNGPSEKQIRSFNTPSENNHLRRSNSNNPNMHFSKNTRKRLFKQYQSKVNEIIFNSNLSRAASDFVRSKTSNIKKVDIKNLLKDGLANNELTAESDKIKEVLKAINEIISEYLRQYPLFFGSIIDSDNIVKKNVSKSPSKINKVNEEADPSNKTTKILSKNQALEEYHDKINVILHRSTLSTPAADFVRSITLSMIKISISMKLIKTISKKKLVKESANILMKIKEINELMDRYYQKYPHYFYKNSLQESYKTKESNSPSSVANKATKKSSTSHSTTKVSSPTKPAIHITERPLKSNEWVSGNYIRKGPAPKYGYARDYFGRVQERDSYREDKEVNPYSSYSSYDQEDDNSSMDILD